MPNSDFIPRPDLTFCSLLAHVRDTIPQYYATLGITAATPQIVTLIADTLAFTYLCNRQTTLTQASQGATRERNRARYGDPENPNVAVDLSWPLAPTPPSPVLPGIEARFRDFVRWLKSLPGYEAATLAKALYLEVDRGTGPAFLVADSNPNYIDTHPLPVTPQKWRYRSIWMRDGQMLGQWSPWIEINVG